MSSQNITVIRRKKVYAADGHHGGAWKVAYADFVTAMMAFFLLMWLLNATTEQQRKGIADYFSPTIPIAAVSGGGADPLSGDSIFTQDTLSQSGTGAEDAKKAPPADAEDAEEAAKADMDKRVEMLNQVLIADKSGLSEHLKIKMSPEGLVIELVDKDDLPLFRSGSASPSDILKRLTKIVALSFNEVANGIKIVGHTDAHAFSGAGNYSNWELSTDRANTARHLLSSQGIPEAQIYEVSGKSSNDPVSDNRFAAGNRRISIILLK